MSSSIPMPASEPLLPIPGRIVTLGQFIIDSFAFSSSTQTQAEQIGGGGTYAIIGARLFLPPSELGIIIDVGTDFPPSMLESLKSYGDEMFAFRAGERLTTRALNLYSGEERGLGTQSFEYLTPKRRISPLDIHKDTPFASPITPSVVHFVCSPIRASEIVGQVRQLGWTKSRLVWEPMPSDCVPSELANLQAVSQHIDVLSPNHLEALTLLSMVPSEDHSELVEMITTATKRLASFVAPGASVVVRAGADGVCYCRATDQGVEMPVWIPAVFGLSEQHKVRDVTGGGNAFLGGLCSGLKLKDDIREAILYGLVSASFAIEQSGLPTASGEIWNDTETGMERLHRFRERVEQERVL